MKKAVIIILTIVAVAVAAGGLYWRSLRGTDFSSNPIDAIPISASVVISYPNLTKTGTVFREQPYHDLLLSIGELERFFARHALIDSLLRTDAEVIKALSGSVVWSSYHALSADSLAFFYALSSVDGQTDKVMTSFKNAMQGTLTAMQWEQRTIFKISGTQPLGTTYMMAVNGLLLASSDINLIKTSFQQLKGGRTLRDDADFERALAVAGKNVEANVFVNFSNVPAYMTGLFRSGTGPLQSALGRIGSWMELDLNMRNQGFALNGFAYSTDSVPHYLNLFLKQKPQPIHFPEVLPSNTAFFIFFGIEDAFTFSADQKELLQKRGRSQQFDALIDSIDQQYDIHIEQNLLAWIGHSFGLCITEPNKEQFADNSYLVVETRSPDLAAKLLDDLASDLAQKQNIVPQTIVEEGILIKQLPLNGIVEALWGPEFAPFNSPYYVILNGHVIFGTSSTSLIAYVQHVLADRTLAKELSFSRFAENLGSTYNIFTYQHLKRSKYIVNSYLNRGTITALERNAEVLRSFEAIGTQISTSGQSFYASAFLKYDPDREDTAETTWEGKMDAKPLGAPVFVKNHLSGEPEILVQDETNALYLFNRMGKRLFKVQLKEPWMSRPLQVDADKNGKLQYIFNTLHFIYLIDRDGNMLDGFPMELSAPAITDLAVLDYDRNKDYRLLITCENNHIYNYNIKGKSVRGWRHDRASDPTIHPFKHLLVSKKDYLVTGESNGKIHLLDRAGKNRVTVEKRIDPSTNNHLQVFASTNAAFTGVYTTDPQGQLYRIALDGKAELLDLGKFSPAHYFLVADLDKDGKPEFVFSDLNTLQVFNTKKEKLFEQRIAPSATAPFLIDLGNKGEGIGYCFKDAEQLVFYTISGEMVNGFPLSGNSEFDMLHTGTENLVVSAGSDTSIIIQSVP